jgi:hypothetical protein
MISPQNKRKELEHILSRENFVKITESIKLLRNETPFRGAIGLLVNFYNESDNSSVKTLIKEFLNDLKDQSSCEEVIGEIKNELKPETSRMLVSSCWQSGLNYSGYSSDFADLFLAGDYMTAIECFTVIESSVNNLTRQEKDSIIKQIRKGVTPGIGEKTALALELISVLE